MKGLAFHVGSPTFVAVKDIPSNRRGAPELDQPISAVRAMVSTMLHSSTVVLELLRYYADTPLNG